MVLRDGTKKYIENDSSLFVWMIKMCSYVIKLVIEASISDALRSSALDRNTTRDFVWWVGMLSNNVRKSFGCDAFSQNRVTTGMKVLAASSSWLVSFRVQILNPIR